MSLSFLAPVYLGGGRPTLPAHRAPLPTVHRREQRRILMDKAKILIKKRSLRFFPLSECNLVNRFVETRVRSEGTGITEWCGVYGFY